MKSKLLQVSFQNLLDPAKEMQPQYHLLQIQQKAGSLEVGQIMTKVCGG